MERQQSVSREGPSARNNSSDRQLVHILRGTTPACCALMLRGILLLLLPTCIAVVVLQPPAGSAGGHDLNGPLARLTDLQAALCTDRHPSPTRRPAAAHLGDGNSVDHLVGVEHAVHSHGLLKQLGGEVHLVSHVAAVDLDLNQVSLLLAQAQLAHLNRTATNTTTAADIRPAAGPLLYGFSYTNAAAILL